MTSIEAALLRLLSAVLCCAVLCCAVLCCAVLCCAVLCCAVLCCADMLSFKESIITVATSCTVIKECASMKQQVELTAQDSSIFVISSQSLPLYDIYDITWNRIDRGP